jgi:tetratricopeptide (TPR) repeat protein
VPVLQINQQPGGAPNHYRISVHATEIPGLSAHGFDTSIEFELTPKDGERIRWYLEDYLQFDKEPAQQIAEGIEVFMARCGEELFCKIFESSAAATGLWSSLKPHLSTTRIEIISDTVKAAAIPWELIRDPNSGTPLALSAASFVRNQHAGRKLLPPAGEAAKLRILLIISRPRGGEDVPFRSVAARLATGLSDEARDAFDIDILRPPTFEQLMKTLIVARERGQPYDIVHFDGHGVYADPRNLADVSKASSRLKHQVLNTVEHGFLMFDEPYSERNSEFVDGYRLGSLLRESGVSVLVLNACQSALAKAQPRPEMEKREDVEAYGSLAQAVMDEGAVGVVAMRYSVYVVTAAHFVAELYGALACGRRLGEAVTWARKNLHHQPNRQIAYEPRPLQDWSVPVVWERAPMRLCAEKPARLEMHLDDAAESRRVMLDQALPARPEVGFFGRDETLYALDRVFDSHRIVLLHASAGSGKTSIATEFARWYSLTGGVKGPVLFTSFERHLPLARVLDKIGIVFGEALQASGIEWDAITDPAQRRLTALQVLQQVPVLWIWDNVEPVTGFPAGVASDWSTEEQRELRTFLSAARDTQAKFLLTSRRDETSWLGDLASRVEVPAMPMQERLQLAAAIAVRRGTGLSELPDLQPLLRFTRGNPLTILVSVGEALRAGIRKKEHMDAFVGLLQNGENAFKDEATEGRSKSLGASLSFAFGAAFNEDERKILALLHLFQGVVHVEVLRVMGPTGAEEGLEILRGLTHEDGTALLDRAAEIGLLNALGAGTYFIHSALPWYFRELFEKYFPEQTGGAANARRAFTEAMGAFGDYCHNRYDDGHREVLSGLVAQENNLLAAWHTARTNGLWNCVTSTMQALQTLYDATGRSAAWRQLVAEVVPEFIDPGTDGPLHGREDEWRLVTDYRIGLADEERKWQEAERLQHLCVDWDRQRAQSNDPQRSEKLRRILGRSLSQLAYLQEQQGNPECVPTYREALGIAKTTEDSVLQSDIALRLGNAFLSIDSQRDLDKAEQWYRQSLNLAAKSDDRARGRILGQLGRVAYARFEDARDNKRPAEELLTFLNESARLYEEALETISHSAGPDRAAMHHQLGNIYSSAGDMDRALHHYHQGIRYSEQAGDIFGAGETRFNVAVALLNAGRFSDAQAYAAAALDNFQHFGDRAGSAINQARRLISIIDEVTNADTRPKSGSVDASAASTVK